MGEARDDQIEEPMNYTPLCAEIKRERDELREALEAVMPHVELPPVPVDHPEYRACIDAMKAAEAALSVYPSGGNDE